MSKSYILNATERVIKGKKTERLREAGDVPAVVYGHGEKNHIISVAKNVLNKTVSVVGESSLIDLVIDNAEPLKVLIHDVQRDPVTNSIIHVDFYAVKMTEKLTTEVPLVFQGEAKAVKELGGVLVKAIDKLKVECLPQDLVHEIVVDLSALNTFDDAIHVEDIKAPAGITIVSHLEDMVASVKPPRSEEEIKAEEAAEAPSVEAVEVEKKGKKEEASETAAGEAVKAEEAKPKKE